MPNSLTLPDATFGGSPLYWRESHANQRSRPSPFANAINFLFLVHSAGVLPCDSSHRRKSFILTICSTAGCLTRTFNSVSPSPISSTQMSPRRIPSACATASYSDSAVTSTACSVPARSRQETRQEQRAMGSRVTWFAFCSPGSAEDPAWPGSLQVSQFRCGFPWRLPGRRPSTTCSRRSGADRKPEKSRVMPAEPRPLHCPVCRRGFRSIASLKRHMDEHRTSQECRRGGKQLREGEYHRC